MTPRRSANLRTLQAWLTEVATEFELHPAVVELAMTLVDHFVREYHVEPGLLQCLGCACFMIAEKWEYDTEFRCPHGSPDLPRTRTYRHTHFNTHELAVLTDGGCGAWQIRRMEVRVLQALGWVVPRGGATQWVCPPSSITKSLSPPQQ